MKVEKQTGFKVGRLTEDHVFMLTLVLDIRIETKRTNLI